MALQWRRSCAIPSETPDHTGDLNRQQPDRATTTELRNAIQNNDANSTFRLEVPKRYDADPPCDADAMWLTRYRRGWALAVVYSDDAEWRKSRQQQAAGSTDTAHTDTV